MKLKYNFVVTDLMSGACAVSVQENENGCKSIVRLDNETTVRIFSLIQEGSNIETIVNTMLDEYDVKPEVLRQEVEKVVSFLEEQGVLER